MRTRITPWMLVWVSLGWLLPASTSAQPTTSLTYRSSQGVEFDVSADGLTAIRAGGRELAHGSWTVFNGEPWFSEIKSGTVKSDKVLEKSFEKIDDHHARVVHRMDEVTCTFNYLFDGEDVTVSARVENRNVDAPMNVIGFHGLEFNFNKPPEGLMCEQNISYFRAHGTSISHPSHNIPIGGSYAQDGSIGVGVSPWRTGLVHTLIVWDYTDWNIGKREKLPSRRLVYLVADPVPARGSQTFDMRLRISPNVDWRHLLDPYRQHFQATFGSLQYKPDYRWIATDYLNRDAKSITPANPYGFHPGFRRIDTEVGIYQFGQMLIPTLQSTHGQGVIIWGQGGEDPRGAMYRPDFDVLPPEVESNWSSLAKRFREAGLKLGICTRPRDIAVRLDWKQDQIITINSDDPTHRNMLWKRFDNMMKRGCTLFYLDSFGSAMEDVKLMRFLREKFGPDVLTFCEQQCDAIMPLSGGFSEATLYAETAPAHYGLTSQLQRWEIYQWLVPGAQLSCRMMGTKGTPPRDMETPDHWFFANHITPLLPVNDFRRASGMTALQEEFLLNPNQFKNR